MGAARHVGVVLVLALFPGLAWGACGDGAGHAQALAEARAAIEIECPCGAATDRGGYRRCVGQALQRRIARLQLPATCAATVLKCAVRSTCGRPGFVACCGMKRGRCRAVRDAARCVRRGGTPGRWASCCDACTPAPEVAFSTAACPSHYAPAACAAGTGDTCHEAFVSAQAGVTCSAGHGDRATHFAPEDGTGDGGRSRAWSFAVRPRGRGFYADHAEATGSLRVVADGLGGAGTMAGASDEAHLRLTAPGAGTAVLALRWFTGTLPAGAEARIRLAKAGEVVAEVTEGPGGPVVHRTTAIVTWTNETEVTVSAALTAPRDAPVESADLFWTLALLEPAADADHDAVPNWADPDPLDRTIPQAPPPSARPRVLVVGLDGAGWDVLDPLMGAGYLPTITGVVGAGARAFLDETPADPGYCCYCPPVWSSLATGQPLARHGMATIEAEPWDRPVPAVWSVLAREGGTSTLVAFRNTAPAEPGATYEAGELALQTVARHRFAVWPFAVNTDDRSEVANRLQGSWPPLLFESAGILPWAGPTPDAWIPFATDRTGAATLAAVTALDPTDLTFWLLHSPDKTEHIAWCQVQPTAADPLDVASLLAGAAQWTGPVVGPVWTFGDVASQNLEADMHLGALLGQFHYDYVILASDHAMTRNVVGSLCGKHETPPAFHGIFAIAGPGIRPGADLGTASVLDVAPTLAYLLDLPVADDLPGRVLTEAFTAEHLAAHPPRSVAHW